MNLAGHPDWRTPERLGGRPLHPAFERPGTFFAPPLRLEAAGAEPLRLEVFQQDRGAAGLAEFGVLSLHFVARHDLGDVRAAALGERPDVRIEPLQAESGGFRLVAADALDLPEAVTALQPADVAGGGGLELSIRLDGAAADLFSGAIRRGLSAVTAEAWLTVRGVAPRAPAAARVDLAAFSAGLARLSGPDGTLDPGAIGAALESDPAGLGVAGLPEGEGRAAAAPALLDRLVGRFGALEPGADGRPEGQVRFSPDTPSVGEVRWDLSEPVLVPRLFRLTADPLGPLRGTSGADLEARLVRRHAAPALKTGRRLLTVVDTLPSRRAGLLRAAVELQAPPAPPARPAASRASVVLEPGAAARAELPLAPGEPLLFRWRTVAFIASEGGVEALHGPEREHRSEHLVVTPADFALRLLPVEAEPALVAEAAVTVRAAGRRRGRPWRAAGVLDAGAPVLVFAVPVDVEDLSLEAEARSLADGQVRRTPSAAPPRLDLFSFEGAGTRMLRLACAFDDGAAEALLELAPEDRPDRPALLRLTPAAPEALWTWVAVSPFRSGYRWRWAGEDRWSDIRQPDALLSLRSGGRPGAMPEGTASMGETMDLEGLRLSSAGEADGAWLYTPLRAGLACGADGRKQFSLIEAGPLAMLALTAQWGAGPDALAAARRALSARTGLPEDQLDLRPSPADVDRVELLLGDGAGAFATAATAGSSGAPPHHAAFNVTLTPEQAGAVKRAMSGERGWLAVRYRITQQPASRRSESFRATAEASVGAAFTAGSRSEFAGVSATAEMSGGSADSAAAVAAEIQSDAAEWGLAA